MINLRNSPFLGISILLLISFWSIEKIGLTVCREVMLLIAGIYLLCSFGSLVRFSPLHQYRSTLILGILIFSAGVLRISKFEKHLYPGDLINGSEYVQGVLEVRQVLKNKETSVSLKCRQHQFFQDEKKTNLIEDKNILVFIKTGSAKQFLPGDIIRVQGWLSVIEGPKNPNAFDARIYYNTIGIRHQLYCKEEDLIGEGDAGFSLERMTAGWQILLSGLVHQHVSAQVAQLTNALVWGDRSDMDSEVRDAFADSGAMHVLSVSGMHVAIIYSMLFYILGAPGNGLYYKRLSRFMLYSFAILLYVGLTGACPAVVRAGLMIILFLFGKSMGWHTQIWNLLGFAAFMMLWINPYVWQNIGFQLSFLAMAGILLFARPVIRFASFKNIIVHNVWQVTALSIVAQIFILPILLRQFHQFPLTFILSSIVAIPAAYLVMLGALINIILSFLNFNLLWPALDWIGALFIKTMIWLSGLNPAMHFSLPSEGSLCLMAMAILFSLAVVFKWDHGKKISWIFGLLCFVTLGCHRIHQWKADDVIVYHSSKGLIMDVFIGGNCYSIHGCHLPDPSIEFATHGFRCERDIISLRNICTTQDYHNRNLKFENSILSLNSYKMLVYYGDTIPKPEFTQIIIDQCPDIDAFTQQLKTYKDVSIILPAHINRKTRKAIITFLEERKMKYHDIDEEGYYRMSL